LSEASWISILEHLPHSSWRPIRIRAVGVSKEPHTQLRHA